jgi:putative ABC transport system permease protein
VAVAVEIDLANARATRAFELSTTTLAGRATHAVEATSGGLPDELFAAIVRTPGLSGAAPVVYGYGSAFVSDPESATTLQVLGIDPFSERPFRPELAAFSGAGLPSGQGPSAGQLVTRPGSGFLTPETAADLGVEPGGRFTLRVAGVDQEVELLGLMEPPGENAREALAEIGL